jgi:hypothetical protein
MTGSMFEDCEELGIVERPAIDVGEDLDSACASRDDAVYLFQRGLNIVEQQ